MSADEYDFLRELVGVPRQASATTSTYTPIAVSRWKPPPNPCTLPPRTNLLAAFCEAQEEYEEEDVEELSEDEEDEGDEEIISPVPYRADIRRKTDNTSSAKKLLSEVLRKGGRRVSSSTAKAVRRRVIRKNPPGYALRVARMLDAAIAEVNTEHDLQQSPLTLRDVLAASGEGAEILAQTIVGTETRVLAQSALAMVQKAGRASRGGAIGILASTNSEGKLPRGRVAALTNISPSWVGSSKKRVDRGELSTFANQSKKTRTLEFDTKRRRFEGLSRILAANPKDTDIFAPYGGRTAAVKDHTALSNALPGMRRTARAAASAIKSISDAEMVHLVCVCSLYGCERSGGLYAL
jgi:hypothetical protein